MYMVTVHGEYTIIWISIFIYIVHSYSVVHIIIASYENIYISIFIYWVKISEIYIYVVILMHAYV